MSESEKGKPPDLSLLQQTEAGEGGLIEEEAAEQAEKAAPTEASQETLYAAEISSLEAEKFRIQNEWLRNELDEAIDLRALRKRYMPVLFCLIVLWLLIVVGFLVLAAIKWFVLSDTVLVAFITSTTASVIGLFAIAARWLFKRPSKPSEE